MQLFNSRFNKQLTHQLRWLVNYSKVVFSYQPLQWRHNERDGISNHERHDCLFNRLFEAQIKENIKAPRHWPLWEEFTGYQWIPRTKGQ